MTTEYCSTSLVFAGDTIEVTHYQKSFPTGFTRNPAGRGVQATEEDQEENRGKCLRRARTQLRRMVLANVGQYSDDQGQPYKPAFLTLTFAENVQDIEQANKVYNLFIKRLNNKLFGRGVTRLKYVVVPEFQKRGAVHYHVVLFNLPYIPSGELAKVWGQGFIKVNSVEEVGNVGAYVCKYLTKEIADERLNGRKHFWGSRGLVQPTTIACTDAQAVALLGEVLPAYTPVYTRSYDSEHRGQIVYTQYRLTSAMQEKGHQVAGQAAADRRRGRRFCGSARRAGAVLAGGCKG